MTLSLCWLVQSTVEVCSVLFTTTGYDPKTLLEIVADGFCTNLESQWQTLGVNWENSFSEGCDDGEAKSAHLRIGHNLSNSFKFQNDRIPVSFDDKQVDVKTDPCLTHTCIRVEHPS